MEICDHTFFGENLYFQLIRTKSNFVDKKDLTFVGLVNRNLRAKESQLSYLLGWNDLVMSKGLTMLDLSGLHLFSVFKDRN